MQEREIKQRIRIESVSGPLVKANDLKTGCCPMETGLPWLGGVLDTRL